MGMNGYSCNQCRIQPSRPALWNSGLLKTKLNWEIVRYGHSFQQSFHLNHCIIRFSGFVWAKISMNIQHIYIQLKDVKTMEHKQKMEHTYAHQPYFRWSSLIFPKCSIFSIGVRRFPIILHDFNVFQNSITVGLGIQLLIATPKLQDLLDETLPFLGS